MTNNQEKNDSSERIAKRIAKSGLCSRRDAEGMIAARRVRLNGEILETPAVKVSASDKIEIDGKALTFDQKQVRQVRLFKYYKPAGLVTTARDEQGRKTVFDDLPGGLPRLISIGRLDLNSEGLLLLTTDGALSRYFELPSTGLAREYRVRVFGRLNLDRLTRLSKGAKIDGVRYAPFSFEVEKMEQSGKNHWIRLTLTEGKNREIRKLMAAINVQVNRLIRISYGPFALDGLKPSGIAELPEKQLHDWIKKAHGKAL